jgi:hypothetical protein
MNGIKIALAFIGTLLLTLLFYAAAVLVVGYIILWLLSHFGILQHFGITMLVGCLK